MSQNFSSGQGEALSETVTAIDRALAVIQNKGSYVLKIESVKLRLTDLQILEKKIKYRLEKAAAPEVPQTERRPSAKILAFKK